MQDAKPLRSEVSDLDARESLLWIRVNWPGALFRKGNPCGKLRRFLMSIRQRSIDWPITKAAFCSIPPNAHLIQRPDWPALKIALLRRAEIDCSIPAVRTMIHIAVPAHVSSWLVSRASEPI